MRTFKTSVPSFVAAASAFLLGVAPAYQALAAPAADYVFTNGKVYTVNVLVPWAEAVAVKVDKIVYVGDTAGAEALVGEGTERIDLKGKSRYPYFARAGVSVSLSSDVPSTPPDMQAPLFVIQGAVTLKNPADPNSKRPPDNEPISPEQAIRAMTIEAAWQIRMEDKIGSLEVGKYADLVVLDRNPFDVDPMELSKIDVLMTMMNGRFTYQAGPGRLGDEEDHPYPGDFERLTY